MKYLDGPLLVLAGAGSGKTRVITQKIAHLVINCGFSAANIAAITFTNKAAREMQERVAKLLPGRAGSLNVCTFHALGVRMLRQEAQVLGLKPRFSILDASDTYAIVAELAKETEKDIVRGLQWQISSWKNAMVGPEHALSLADDDLSLMAAHLYREYERSLRAYQAVDFDDLIRLPVQMFQEHPEVLKRWQFKLRYLLVDEYQDTNRCQYTLLHQLAGQRGMFTAVGDDDQAIYGWRGADVDNLRQLQRDYPSLKVIKLEQNYRSTSRILRAANTLIENNTKLFEKKLWSEHGLGDVIHITMARDPDHEAEMVAMKLLAHKFEQRTHFKDYAILYRGNHQARVFEQQLRNQRIPYVISGGQSFFDKAEIKDITAYLRIMANGDDDPAFIRAITTPRRGIGAATLEALGQYAGHRHLSLFHAAQEVGAEEHVPARQLTAVREFCDFIIQLEIRARKEPPRAILADLLKAIDFETWLFEHFEPNDAEGRWDNVRDFIDWLSKKGDEDGKTLEELTQTVALISMLDKGDEDLDAVQLATLHASKGLEFGHVFLVGVEEGMLPHRQSVEEGKIEEERRLMYVGITRAQRSLHISWCERRTQARERRTCEPSRFLDEMVHPAHKDDVRHSGGRQDTLPDKAQVKDKIASIRAMLTAMKEKP